MKYRYRQEKDDHDLIIHLCRRKAWQEAKARGVYHAPSLDSEGFIHCSQEHQILQVANTFYRNVRDLVLLWIDASKVKPEIRWEQVEGESFPHIYGPLNVDAVVRVSDLIPDEDNTFRWL